MIERKHPRRPLGLNSTSTADISFVLLIFFIITTSMGTDKGIPRQLPPIDPKEKPTETEVQKDKVLAFRITSANQLLADGRPTCPEEAGTLVVKLLRTQGKEHLLTIESDPEARYDTYFQLQNAIVAAYRTRRDQLARQQYGRTFAQCSPTQRESIRTRCPQRIVENYNTSRGGQQP